MSHVLSQSVHTLQSQTTYLQCSLTCTVSEPEAQGYPEGCPRVQSYNFLHSYAIWCCEKLKIGIVPSNHKIKLPFDMDFNKIEKFFKNFHVFDCPQGAKEIGRASCRE